MNQEQEKSESRQTETEQKPAENQPANEPARVCTICGGPDHRGCGCEARTKKLSESVKGLDKNTSEAVVATALMQGQDFKIFQMTVNDRLSDIQASLQMIVSQLNVMIEAERSRADLLRDIQNASGN